MKLKLKKGNRVYVKLPRNATIVRVDKKLGYILKTDDRIEWSYFSDEDVQEIEETHVKP